jgi:anti-sigma B factor antagonist
MPSGLRNGLNASRTVFDEWNQPQHGLRTHCSCGCGAVVMDMNLQTSIVDRLATIALEGDIDLSCSQSVRSALLAQLRAGNGVAVRMLEVTYIDSSGVASLVEAYQLAKKLDLRFQLLDVSEAAMSVLRLARLDRVFPMVSSAQATGSGRT